MRLKLHAVICLTFLLAMALSFTSPAAALTLPVEGRFLLGIRAIRMLDGEQVAVSEAAWSDEPATVALGQTFGVLYFKPAGRVTGFARQGG